MLSSTRLISARAALIAIFVGYLGGRAIAQGRTDVVTLANGDRITGEVVRLDRGRLEFKTDDVGTLYIEWDNLSSVVAGRLVEVILADGSHYLGTLGPSPVRSLTVVGPVGGGPIPMHEVTEIAPIGRSFWSRLDGSIDAGYSYTRSSGIAQLTANSSTVYRRPASQARFTTSVTLTQQDDDEGRDDRGAVEASYLLYPWQRWFVITALRFDSNESLGLTLRSQIGAAVGPRLVNSNRAQLSAGAGMVFNDEIGVDVERTQNVEALFVFQTSFFTYDRPKTNLDISLQYYPSLSDPGRHRLQFDAAVKRELWKDLFVGFNGYNTFDSRPPNPSADQNDVGIVASIGWSY